MDLSLSPRAASLLALCAAGTLGWEMARGHSTPRAWRAAATPALEARDGFRMMDTTSDEMIARGTERDPFFRVANVLAPTQPLASETTAIATDTLRVLGTVVDSLGGSFALCQLGAASPVLVRAGQKIGEYELRSVDKATAIFATADGRRAERRVPRAGG